MARKKKDIGDDEKTYAKGEMPMSAAGRKGGKTRLAAIGPEGYGEMGRVGGQTTSERHGPEFYSEIGRKGGETVRRERGPEFFSQIGRKGGKRVSELCKLGREGLDEDERAGLDTKS